MFHAEMCIIRAKLQIFLETSMKKLIFAIFAHQNRLVYENDPYYDVCFGGFCDAVLCLPTETKTSC